MEVKNQDKPILFSEHLRHDLGALGIPVHLHAYEYLCIGVPLYSMNPTQSLCCELYPAIAKTTGYCDWRAVEFSIRRAIRTAWEHRNPEVWADYFPGQEKAPTNKQFIATLTLHIENPLPEREGK